MKKHWTWSSALLIALACAAVSGCGDDDEDITDAGKDGAAAESGSGGKSGSGGSTAGRGGTGGRGGAGAGGRSGNGGSGATGGTGGMTAMCMEAPPTQPVVCGGQTCTTPTDYPMNQCIVPCCATKNGAQVCGAKSTNPQYPTGCEPPTVEDTSCPPFDAMGMQLKACCNAAMGKCGIISTLRPGCITTSSVIMLPDPPQACSAGGDDAGAGDAGL
ncbi:MAG TPA: hypothetical protein VJR89_08200 [Polyangiales bacterium]|nr:hypothetical protein [Polyangiales bacterium]